jgi:hypothetical protein
MLIVWLGHQEMPSLMLLLVRDKGGAVFGGIAHAPWQRTGTFYGEQIASAAVAMQRQRQGVRGGSVTRQHVGEWTLQR